MTPNPPPTPRFGRGYPRLGFVVLACPVLNLALPSLRSYKPGTSPARHLHSLGLRARRWG